MSAGPEINEDEYLALILCLPDKLGRCVELLAQRYLKDSDLKSYYLPYLLYVKLNDGISQK